MNLTQLYNEIFPKAGAFLAVFFIVMVIGYGILYFLDFIPEAPATEANEVASGENISANQNTLKESNSTQTTKPVTTNDNSDPLPISITIDKLDRTITVLNPASRNINDLDAALLNGVVRHPDSADLNDKNGNILILGHSSYLKNVFNKNYQAFNGIQNLTWGDTITLKSKDFEYTYRIDRVYQAKASAVTVPTRSTEQKLTLATCDTFGAKEDRFIVEATLVGKKAL